jgi:hypothetical protein
MSAVPEYVVLHTGSAAVVDVDRVVDSDRIDFVSTGVGGVDTTDSTTTAVMEAPTSKHSPDNIVSVFEDPPGPTQPILVMSERSVTPEMLDKPIIYESSIWEPLEPLGDYDPDVELVPMTECEEYEEYYDSSDAEDYVHGDINCSPPEELDPIATVVITKPARRTTTQQILDVLQESLATNRETRRVMEAALAEIRQTREAMVQQQQEILVLLRYVQAHPPPQP